VGRPKPGKGSKEKLDEREKALELTERAGIPLWGAFRVVRGEITLNELLKSMLRREKFRRLQKEGLDPDLSGHVASGSLPRWRAVALQDMRKAGRSKFTRDRIEIALREETPLGVWCFDKEWMVGRVLKARTYDFMYEHGGADKPELVHKHDVKMICGPDAVEALGGNARVDDQVKEMGLSASKDRNERYRPTDQQLCRARDAAASIRWTFRDGTTVRAKVIAFGRWDIDLELKGGEGGTIFFHALHQATEAQLAKFC
jgi:hypothetical protein